MSDFKDLEFKIDEDLNTSATITFENGVGAKIVREEPTAPFYPYRIHVLRDGNLIGPDDKLQKFAKNIDFLHGTIGVTCVLVGLETAE